MNLTAPQDLLLVMLGITVLAPLAAAGWMASGLSNRSPRTGAVVAMSLSLLASLAVAWQWHNGHGVPVEFGDRLGGGALIDIDGVTAVLLPYVALVGLAIVIVAPKRFLDAPATARTLAGVGATLALFSTAHPLALVALSIVTALPTWWSLRSTPGGSPAARIFALAMVPALICLTAGTLLMLCDPPWEKNCGMVGATGGWLVAAAVLLRKGIVPVHSWYPALFSAAPMSTALVATMPQVASYLAVRLLIGHADHGQGVAVELIVLSQLALVTAVYGAALALVQRELRGLIGMLAMSQSALVLAGLSGKLPMELSGAFCVWISSGLALTGIGLVAWALESRAGPLSLETHQGRFRDSPMLAAFFLLFGLACIGLPGTLSFVADDLIVSGSLDEQLHAGLLVIAATVLSGIAVMRAWFMIFGGPEAVDGPRHQILPRERLALTVLLATLFVLGINPAPLVRVLDRAAGHLLGVPVQADGHGHAEPPPAPL